MDKQRSCIICQKRFLAEGLRWRTCSPKCARQWNSLSRTLQRVLEGMRQKGEATLDFRTWLDHHRMTNEAKDSYRELMEKLKADTSLPKDVSSYDQLRRLLTERIKLYGPSYEVMSVSIWAHFNKARKSITRTLQVEMEEDPQAEIGEELETAQITTEKEVLNMENARIDPATNDKDKKESSRNVLDDLEVIRVHDLLRKIITVKEHEAGVMIAKYEEGHSDQTVVDYFTAHFPITINNVVGLRKRAFGQLEEELNSPRKTANARDSQLAKQVELIAARQQMIRDVLVEFAPELAQKLW